ncbi:DUF2480 family protein [Mangrovimonas aestuarii]|uniref:DUF2480 family protein n=1 Tax=Mangrovimonas aestuarii TaxID=3018443 RepID=UPI002377E800|nr:DUF2480 family protein [Mangrovimonas aestuarii]
MADEIINRVANSKLVTFDLEEYYPKGQRILFDIKDWLFEGFVLREKDFRTKVKEHDWSQYQDCYVAITCSTDAIVPAWAFMLISLNLSDYAKNNVFGTLEDLETSLYHDIIDTLDIEEFKDRPVIIKGCSKKPVPVSAYIMACNKLKTVAKSIMFGEACSSVPLFRQ